EGTLLAGAASLGALRAVELEKFGMVGIGKIFQLYKSRKINADDEVAVTFAPEGDYKLQSEAMLDIRYNLFLAKKKDIIGSDTKKVLASVAKEIYFPHRNYAHIIEEARNRYKALDGEIRAFEKYIGSNRKSLKEIDAIRLVRYFKDRFDK
ncbi:MAG: TfuA-like protein, partial [Nitrososphaera sp.]|nr:TfuA-like protein [Nitrososphaera sp.]